MSTQVFTDADVFIDKYEISGDLNQISLNVGAEMVEATTYGAAARIKKPGLYTVEYTLNGLCNFGTGLSDELLFGNVGVLNVPHTIVPENAQLGSTAYFFKANQGQYSPGGAIGELLKFTVNGAVSGAPAVRGFILEPGKTMRTSTFQSSQVLVGAAAASQKLYAVLHVLAVQGTTKTLDVVIESDTTGFPSPTSKITFAHQTAVGSVYATPLAGANTDTYYRVNATIGGTGSPGFTFCVAVGIL